jgi:hypothetical protein
MLGSPGLSQARVTCGAGVGAGVGVGTGVGLGVGVGLPWRPLAGLPKLASRITNQHRLNQNKPLRGLSRVEFSFQFIDVLGQLDQHPAVLSTVGVTLAE